MAIFTNFSRHSVGEVIGLDARGAEFYAVVVKATYTWDAAGNTTLTDVPEAVAEEDVYADPTRPGETSVVLEADLVPQKPRIDVVLLGAIDLPTAVEQIDVTLAVGERIRKTARVYGDRRYMPSMFADLAPDRPRPFQRMPIAWERCFGGMDPEHPKTLEPRNPQGVGLRHHARALEARPAPNFEDPRHLIGSWRDRPRPIGFGPVGRWWQPRIQLGGTYDEAWREDRFPLLPFDFDPRYYNCAPEDQQLDRYLVGEEVKLTYMTRAGHDRFRLPAFEVPVRFSERHQRTTSAVIRPDTVIIEPAERRFSVLGRAVHYPRPNIVALRQVLVGQPPPAFLRAQAHAKNYLVPRTLKPWGAP
jgi:hypothetical protein